MPVNPNQSDIQIALRSFLTTILPANVTVLAGQANRVAEPAGADFVVFWPIRRNRIETNIDLQADVQFTGNISGTTLAVSAVAFGTLQLGATIFGSGVTPNTTVVSFISGVNGGVGFYTVSNSQIVTSETMAGGVTTYMQPTEVTFQLDVHGPGSSDNAQIISTLFRDDYAVQQFLSSGFDVTPLFADDPTQVPFINAEDQFETRWIVEAHLQANQIVTLPQQYASQVNLGVVSVTVAYPH